MVKKLNVAVSFCGEGFGHASRIAALAEELKNYHNLTFWCPDSVQAFFASNYKDAEIYNVPLLSLVKKHNKLQAYETVKVNLAPLFLSNKIIDNLARQLIELEIDFVISDYEPFLVKAARKVGIPVLLFNHPGIITRFPKFSISYLFSRVTAGFMMPGFTRENTLISSFYDGDVGPIIRNEVKNAVIKNDNFILVYLKTSLKDKILPVLENFKEQTFRFFPDKNYDFVSSLATCKAVIAPAGHQLISECLYLKKPLLVIPESGQYEQLLNAEMLLKTGLGEIISEKEMFNSISHFFHLTDKGFFKENENLFKFNLNDDLYKAVNKINTFLQACNRKENSLSNSSINSERLFYEHK